MPQRGEEMGLAPVWAPGARALILGSYPSPQSFAANFYYGHPQNRFWPLLAALAGEAVPHTTEEKTALVLGHNLALWDTLARCRITGAEDASIQDPVPNDIAGLIAKSRIEAVFCNGAASHRFYQQYCEAKTGLAATRLPSTSPANASYNFARLLEGWRPLAAWMTPDAPTACEAPAEGEAPTA